MPPPIDYRGTWSQDGRLLFDAHGHPVTAVQDPDTGDLLYLRQDGSCSLRITLAQRQLLEPLPRLPSELTPNRALIVGVAALLLAGVIIGAVMARQLDARQRQLVEPTPAPVQAPTPEPVDLGDWRTMPHPRLTDLDLLTPHPRPDPE